MGKFQHVDHDTDFTWETWKFQETRIASLQRELEQARRQVEVLTNLHQGSVHPS